MTITVDKVFSDNARIMSVSSFEPGWYARLVVEDKGEGMDEQTVARLFEPFFTTKKPGEGTGLGLAVVHSIVREHEGALEVASQCKQGTRISVCLPLHDGQASKDTESKSCSIPCGHGERVLFVDDE